MSSKLMTPTEKDIESFSTSGKESIGCLRHEKDILLSYTYKNQTNEHRELLPAKDIFEQFKDLDIDKQVLMQIINAAQKMHIKEKENPPKEIIDLFMSDKQAAELIKILQNTLKHNK